MSSLFEKLKIESVPRTGLSIVEAAESVGVCERTMGELVKDGTIPSFRIGRRRVVPLCDLRKRLSELAATEGGAE